MVKVVTDSPSDIPKEVAEELGISIVPIKLAFGTETFLDGVDLTTDEFYARLASTKVMPTTAVPSPRAYIEVFDRLAQETDEILVITVSAGFSAMHRVATQAKEETRGTYRVEVVDSRSGAMAEGLIVIQTARAAKAGAGMAELIELTESNIPRSEIRMAFDTLEYLKRGGRIGRAQALLGSMLRVHPILGIKDGEAFPFARERSRAKVLEYLYSYAAGFSKVDSLAIEDATTPDDAASLAMRLTARFPEAPLYRAKVTPVVGAHVGPHALALAVLGDR